MRNFLDEMIIEMQMRTYIYVIKFDTHEAKMLIQNVKRNEHINK